jgi:D-beta-D-heptose 7-phosphate kinase/D-beta-D-heptose 1-phosphate adenosyltransferase
MTSQTSVTEYRHILEALPKLKAFVVGDLMLDRYIWGRVDRISQEAPVPVVEVKRTEQRVGGAGNAAMNLACLGLQVSLGGLVGDDDEGNQMLALLDTHHIDKEAVLVDRSRPTTLKTRVIAQSQQVLRIDREQVGETSRALQEAFVGLFEAKIADSDVVIVSDYGKGAVSNPLLLKIKQISDQGNFSLRKKPILLDPRPRSHDTYAGFSIVKPNRKEAEVAARMEINTLEDACEAARKLIDIWQSELVVVTMGEKGMLLLERGASEPLHLETRAREVFDVSGAGDTVSAVLAAAFAAGASPRVAGELANIAAGIVVSEVGTAPITRDKLSVVLSDMTGDDVP